MPELSRFKGIIIRMYYDDVSQHYKPHVHVFYGGEEAVVALDGEVLAGRGDRSRGVGVVARGADWGGGGGVGGHGNLPGAGFQMLLHWTPERFE